MEKIGLLEDINKGNSNPDVKQRERERSERMLMVSDLMVGMGGKEEEKTSGKPS